MNPAALVFAQVAVTIVGLVGSLAGITVLMVRALHPKRLAASVQPPSDAQLAQLEQLQQSVDAIAVEVERIAEAQRFSAKLLAERADPALISRSDQS